MRVGSKDLHLSKYLNALNRVSKNSLNVFEFSYVHIKKRFHRKFGKNFVGTTILAHAQQKGGAPKNEHLRNPLIKVLILEKIFTKFSKKFVFGEKNVVDFFFFL